MLFEKRGYLRDVKAIIFDVDGVLVTSLKTKAVPKSIFLKLFSEEKLKQAFGSIDDVPEEWFWQTEDLKRELSEKTLFCDDSDELFQEFAIEFFLYNLEKGTITHNPDILVLPLLAKHFSLGIVTNNVCESVRVHLKEWLHLFRGIKTWECMPAKPDPQGFRGLCQEMGFNPCETLYIGDSLSDIQTANKAGAWSCAAKWDITLPESCEKIKQDNYNNPKFIGFLDSLYDIAALFSIEV